MLATKSAALLPFLSALARTWRVQKLTTERKAAESSEASERVFGRRAGMSRFITAKSVAAWNIDARARNRSSTRSNTRSRVETMAHRPSKATNQTLGASNVVDFSNSEGRRRARSARGPIQPTAHEGLLC